MLVTAARCCKKVGKKHHRRVVKKKLQYSEWSTLATFPTEARLYRKVGRERIQGTAAANK